MNGVVFLGKSKKLDFYSKKTQRNPLHLVWMCPIIGTKWGKVVNRGIKTIFTLLTDFDEEGGTDHVVGYL